MRRSLLLCVMALQPISLVAQQPCPAGTSAFVGGRASTGTATRSFGDLSVCGTTDMLNAGEVSPAEWLGRAPLVVLETNGAAFARVMRVEPSSVVFTTNGVARPVDSTANEWRSAVVEILDATWRLARLRAREANLQAELSALRGRPAGAQGMVVSTPLDAEAIRAERSRLATERETIAADVSRVRDDQENLRRDVKYEQTAIVDLQSQLRSAGSQAERNRINQEIRRHNGEIRRLQSALDRYEMDVRSRGNQLAEIARKIERLDREIRGTAHVREASGERPSAADMAAQVVMLERQLADLEVDRNVRELDARAEAAAQRLRRLQ